MSGVIEALRFDPHNPRLPSSIDSRDETAVLNWMLVEGSVIELMDSIGQKCCFPGEPLLATAERDYYEVVEGNRECYDYFGSKIDPHQYLTEENFRRLGLTIEDAEEQIIGIRGQTAAPDVSFEARWQMLRGSTPGSEIAWIFQKYLD